MQTQPMGQTLHVVCLCSESITGTHSRIPHALPRAFTVVSLHREVWPQSPRYLLCGSLQKALAKPVLEQLSQMPRECTAVCLPLVSEMSSVIEQ